MGADPLACLSNRYVPCAMTATLPTACDKVQHSAFGRLYVRQVVRLDGKTALISTQTSTYARRVIFFLGNDARPHLFTPSCAPGHLLTLTQSCCHTRSLTFPPRAHTSCYPLCRLKERCIVLPTDDTDLSKLTCRSCGTRGSFTCASIIIMTCTAEGCRGRGGALTTEHARILFHAEVAAPLFARTTQ